MPFVPHDGSVPTIPRGLFDGTGTRMFIHNLAANPNVAKQYMASLGNDIRDYGNGHDWNFAWKKSGDRNAPWTPADSHTFGGWILNHVADVINGIVTGAAATGSAALASETGPGAIAAGMAGGAAASGGVETLRQGLGSAAGIPNNLDTGEITGATIGGALAEPVGAAGGAIVRGAGRLLGGVLRGAGNVVPEIAAKIADIEALGTESVSRTSPGKVLMEGSRLTKGGKIALETPQQAGQLLRDAISAVQRGGIAEVNEADRRIAAQEGNGVLFNLKNMAQTIKDYAVAPGEIGATPKIRVDLGSSKTLKADVANLYQRLAETGFEGDWAKTPPTTAVEVRRILQNEAANAGAYEGAGGSKIYTQIVKTASAQARAAIEAGMAPLDPDFAPLMAKAYEKLNTLDHFVSKLKMADKGVEGRRAATQYVRGVYGDGKVDYVEALADLDKHFSGGANTLVARALGAVRRANVGKAIGERGLGPIVPRITSGGHIRSSVALLGLGYAAGGPIGLAAGAVAASPRVIMRAAPYAAAAGAKASSAAAALAKVQLGGASRVLTTGTISAGTVAAMRSAIRSEGGGSKGMARQDQPRRRKRIVIGS